MTFEELLQQNPALRRLRSLDADTLRRLFGRLRGECTWCGTNVPKGRSTWCSNACVDSFSHRCCPNKSAWFIQNRDRNICRLCGVNVQEQQVKFEQQFKAQTEELKQSGRLASGSDYYIQERKRKNLLQEQFCFARGRWFEIDHEIPVSEGGGLCHPDQLRLLCGKCHARETAELQARLAKKKSEKSSQPKKPSRKEKQNVDQ